MQYIGPAYHLPIRAQSGVGKTATFSISILQGLDIQVNYYIITDVSNMCHLDKRNTGTGAVSNQRIGTADSKGIPSLIYYGMVHC